VDNDVGLRIERLARGVSEITVNVAYACGEFALVLAAVKNSDLVAEGVEPSDRVWSSKSRAS
jgi:hypothetical protein